jgi:toxin ParE1/3/4
MMHRIELRPAAARDLDAIADYTKQQWGKGQARLYLAAIRANIESLKDFPMRHPAYQSEGKEFRKLLSGHHLIFYRIIGDTVQVIRILHERMDVDRHL